MSKINTLLEEAIDLLNESSESLNEGAKYRKDTTILPAGNTPYDYGKRVANQIKKAKESENKVKELKDARDKLPFYKKADKEKLDKAIKRQEDMTKVHNILTDEYKKQGKEMVDIIRKKQKLGKVLAEAAILLENNYEVRRGNLLYNGNEFIGSFDNEREKNELIEEYEEEQNKKLNKPGTNNN